MPFFSPVSVQFSNAVLVAILPYFSDFAAKLNLPIPLPITEQHVARFMCDPREAKVGGCVFLTNGYTLWFEEGVVKRFRSPQCYSVLQEPDDIPKFYGKVNLSRKQAQALAVESLTRLGYPLEACFVDPKPKVTPPARLEGKVVPRYRFEWLDPSSGNTSIDVEVNAENKRLEMLSLSSRNFWREPPHVNGYDYKKARRRSMRVPQDVPLTHSNIFVLENVVFPQVAEFVGRLGWPVKTPVTTNQLQDITYQRELQELYLRLTNGYRFTFANGYVQAAYTPNCFFNGQPPMRIQEFLGKWKIRGAAAIKLARETLNKLGYSGTALGIDKDPRITRPFTKSLMIPRFLLAWRQDDDGILESSVDMEIDANKKRVTSICIYDSWKNKEVPGIALPSGTTRAKMIYEPSVSEKIPLPSDP